MTWLSSLSSGFFFSVFCVSHLFLWKRSSNTKQARRLHSKLKRVQNISLTCLVWNLKTSVRFSYYWVQDSCKIKKHYWGKTLVRPSKSIVYFARLKYALTRSLCHQHQLFFKWHGLVCFQMKALGLLIRKWGSFEFQIYLGVKFRENPKKSFGATSIGGTPFGVSLEIKF